MSVPGPDHVLTSRSYHLFLFLCSFIFVLFPLLVDEYILFIFRAFNSLFVRVRRRQYFLLPRLILANPDIQDEP